MIFYLTKETAERYKAPMQETNEILETQGGDRLLEWGGKLFYFERRKCLQVVNFASKVTFFLVDIKKEHFPHIGNLIAMYLMDLYAGDAKMQQYVEQYFSQAPEYCFSKLKDKSAISTLNRTQWELIDDGWLFYRHMKNNVLMTREMNRDVNWNRLVTQTAEKKTEYFYPAEKFQELLVERYGK